MWYPHSIQWFIIIETLWRNATKIRVSSPPFSASWPEGISCVMPNSRFNLRFLVPRLHPFPGPKLCGSPTKKSIQKARFLLGVYHSGMRTMNLLEVARQMVERLVGRTGSFLMAVRQPPVPPRLAWSHLHRKTPSVPQVGNSPKWPVTKRNKWGWDQQYSGI